MSYLRHVKTGAVYHYSDLLMKTGNFAEATVDDFNACYGLAGKAQPQQKTRKEPQKIGAPEATAEKDAVDDHDGQAELEQLLDDADSDG